MRLASKGPQSLPAVSYRPGDSLKRAQRKAGALNTQHLETRESPLTYHCHLSICQFNEIRNSA
jgi:hypothetical protein